MARDVLITRGSIRGITRICQPIAVRTQGGLQAEGRILEFRNFLRGNMRRNFPNLRIAK